ncbi:MAG: GNAT family N-acetyltransferase [Defluviitaleaceae bacterium]|nr:GNAT family N-acetyltransferase [Defluviitaleaceae bacterium]
MQLNIYKDVKQFYKDTYNILMGHEVENLIPLGNLIIGNEGKDKTGWRDPANWLMATVTEAREIKLTAIMTPPFGITLYETDNVHNPAALECLVKGLLDTKISVPRVMTNKSLAENFTKLYTKATGQNHEIYMRQRVFKLSKVNPQISTHGTMRLVRPSDMTFFPYWVEHAMNIFTGRDIVIPDTTTDYDYRIDKKLYYILEDDGVPVTMACITREMQNIAGVGMVYTPPYFRSKGYASSCVAQLSQLILDRGFKYCVLYTDLTNPTSNSIYQKIGYEAVCDFLEIKFM